MRVLLILFLVGIVSRSQGYSYEDGDHFPTEWSHGYSSHDYSERFESSEVALADGDVNLANSGESYEKEKPVVTIKKVEIVSTEAPEVPRFSLRPVKIVSIANTMKPIVHILTVKTMKPKTIRPIILKTTSAPPAMPTSFSKEIDY